MCLSDTHSKAKAIKRETITRIWLPLWEGKEGFLLCCIEGERPRRDGEDRAMPPTTHTLESSTHGKDWCKPGDLSVQFSRSVVSDSLQIHGLQHARPPCPSPTPRVYSNSCPLSQWCHSTTSLSVVPFSSCLQTFPASGSFPMSQFFTSGGQSIGVSASASVLPMNIQDWFPLGWTG